MLLANDTTVKVVAGLFGGWLLMVPPAGKQRDAGGVNRWIADTSRPMSSWDQEAAYDTAADCERGKEALLSRYVSKTNQATFKQALGEDGLAQMLVTAPFARCAPPEHVYPAKRPSSAN